ncbi:MAG: hypothetical protein D3922_08685, partial [Candidatus Electrothrix sp. AR1]|nr:hypothetical protein [Candidatus Electrothrix sp. AR1]
MSGGNKFRDRRNVPLFPVVVAGLLGAALWSVLPDCYKPPIIDFLLNLAITVLKALPDLPLFGPLWSLLKPGVIGFLERIKQLSNEEKIQVTNKIAKIMLWSGIDFVAGYVWGLLKGVWEALTDPFAMLWMLGKGLFDVTGWLTNIGERVLGKQRGQVPAPNIPTPHVLAVAKMGEQFYRITGNTTLTATEAWTSAQELGERVLQMAKELQPPAEEVKDNFFDAAKEYFNGSEGASFDTLREKLGEAWGSAQGNIEAQGGQLAERTAQALLAPNAETAAAKGAFSAGEFIGWLAGTIITEVLIAYFSAGTVTAAKGIMKAVTAIAKVVDKIGDIFGMLFRLIGRLGKGLFKLIKGAGKMFASAGRGAISTVMNALTTIARKLGRFSDEILAKIKRRAGPKAKTKPSPDPKKPKRSKGKKKGKDKKKDKEKKIRKGLAAIDREEIKYLKEGKIEEKNARKVAYSVKKRHRVFKYLKVFDGGERWDYFYIASPGNVKRGEKKKYKNAIDKFHNQIELADIYAKSSLIKAIERKNREFRKKNWNKVKSYIINKDVSFRSIYNKPTLKKHSFGRRSHSDQLIPAYKNAAQKHGINKIENIDN